jgi:hypothetical protein
VCNDSVIGVLRKSIFRLGGIAPSPSVEMIEASAVTENDGNYLFREGILEKNARESQCLYSNTDS